jgi:hypothetical protein
VIIEFCCCLRCALSLALTPTSAATMGSSGRSITCAGELQLTPGLMKPAAAIVKHSLQLCWYVLSASYQRSLVGGAASRLMVASADGQSDTVRLFRPCW